MSDDIQSVFNNSRSLRASGARACTVDNLEDEYLFIVFCAIEFLKSTLFSVRKHKCMNIRHFAYASVPLIRQKILLWHVRIYMQYSMHNTIKCDQDSLVRCQFHF